MKHSSSATQRRYDLDWLRVLVILVVFIFHSGRFFDLDDWHVKNQVIYLGAQVWTVFLAHWMMPLVFFISGASTYYALGSRRAARFVKDRALRLLVPLVVGVFTHIPLQVYLERLTHGQFKGSFFEFIPHYFEGWYGFGGNFAWMGLHLWYLLMLFIFSLLLLPLFLWLRGEQGQRLLDRVGSFLARLGMVYLLALPLSLLLCLLDPGSLAGNRSFGGWSLILYLFFFFYGFLVFPSQPLLERIRRGRWLSLAVGVLLVAAVAALWVGKDDPLFGTPRFWLVFSLFGSSSWCWILALVGFVCQHLNFSTPRLAYANEAVLPFYILHQTVLVCLGFYTMQWPIPDSLKYFLTAAIAFAIIALLYEFLARRYNLLRWLFGMRPLE